MLDLIFQALKTLSVALALGCGILAAACCAAAGKADRRCPHEEEVVTQTQRRGGVTVTRCTAVCKRCGRTRTLWTRAERNSDER